MGRQDCHGRMDPALPGGGTYSRQPTRPAALSA
jgi:hypothetical protein